MSATGRGAAPTPQDELAELIAEELRLRTLGNTEGIQRARSGEITRRQYKDQYYAPVIRLQFRIDELERMIAGEAEDATMPAPAHQRPRTAYEG